MGKQNKKLLKNIEIYEQEEKAKQSKPKILGQKLVKGKENNLLKSPYLDFLDYLLSILLLVGKLYLHYILFLSL